MKCKQGIYNIMKFHFSVVKCVWNETPKMPTVFRTSYATANGDGKSAKSPKKNFFFGFEEEGVGVLCKH